MSLEEIRKRLEFMNLAKVGRSCGVSRELLSRWMRGDVENMSANTYIRLIEFFRKLDNKGLSEREIIGKEIAQQETITPVNGVDNEIIS